ncbi:MAG: hypothetical protein ACO1N4_04980 [Pedobacter sp.]
MKGKIQGAIGLLIIGFIVFGLVRSIYSRNFADEEVTVLTPSKNQAPIKNALLWYEMELEKTLPSVSAHLNAEEMFFVQPLYNSLKPTGMVSDYIKTMSEKATARMIELGAYSGKEPDVWQMAKDKGYPYVFKVVISNASAKSRSNDLESLTYLYSLYNVADSSVVWEAKSTRLAGFFGGMNAEKSVSALTKQLKASKITQ